MSAHEYRPRSAGPADTAAIFQPLELGGLRIKNRILRSSISGRIDNYGGSGTPARIRFEERFARGGVGAILSSHVPIAPEARILPHYAMIDRDERIDFWRSVGRRVHAHDCKFILQLSHGGRQQDIGGIENLGRLPAGVTARGDLFQGLRSRVMSESEIRRVVELPARQSAASPRPRERPRRTQPAALHLLQPLPGAGGRKPAGLLRAEPLPGTGRPPADDRRDLRDLHRLRRGGISREPRGAHHVSICTLEYAGVPCE
jgi:hypothetical protein